MSNTALRVLTALVLIPIVVGIVLYAPPWMFKVAIVLAVMAGAWEWLRLLAFDTRACLIYLSGLALSTASVIWGPSENEWFAVSLVWVGVLWWLVAPAWLFLRHRRTPEKVMREAQQGGIIHARDALAGWLVLVPAGISLAMVHGWSDGGPQLVLTLFLIVWAADSGAWFAGRRWGRRPLAPEISPSKTWEGAVGGVLAGVAAGALAAWWFALPFVAAVILIAFVAAVISIVGDLYESLHKRLAGLKDSGTWLPGHGGLLDRIDGLTAAAPVYAVAMGAVR